jgi:hypothetical protein
VPATWNIVLLQTPYVTVAVTGAVLAWRRRRRIGRTAARLTIAGYFLTVLAVAAGMWWMPLAIRSGDSARSGLVSIALGAGYALASALVLAAVFAGRPRPAVHWQPPQPRAHAEPPPSPSPSANWSMVSGVWEIYRPNGQPEPSGNGQAGS